MTSTDSVRAKARPRDEAFHTIEGRHFRRCLQQTWADGRRTLIELMEWPKAKTQVIVVKQYESPVPPIHSSKPWPDLRAVHVYTSIDTDDGGTWEGLDMVLTQYEELRQRGEPAQAINVEK